MIRMLFGGIGAVTLLLTLFTASVMIVSPRRWFELPTYLGFHGGLKRSLLSTVWGRLQIRITGLALATGVVAIIAGIVSRYSSAGLMRMQPAGTTKPAVAVLIAVTCLLSFREATLMIVKPQACFERNWKPFVKGESVLLEIRAIPFIRGTGLVILAVACWLAWHWWKTYIVTLI